MRSIGLHVILGLFSIFLHSQFNVLNASDPDQVGIDKQSENEKSNDFMLKYSYVIDRDVLWSKTVWETLDLEQRTNMYLYYPVDTLSVGPDRRSLFDVLMKNIRVGKIKKIYADSYFNEKLSYDDILSTMSKIDTLDAGREQYNAGEQISPEYIVKTSIGSMDIREYRIKGMWYFDKRQGILKYRLLGIAPVSRDVNFKDDETQPLVELFWIWYPDAREALHGAKVFNPENTSDRISFDNILTTRRYDSVIYKEDNVYDDRPVKDYIKDNAFLQLLESRKIKEKVRDKEDDLWNY